MRIFVGRLEESRLANRPDLFDWLCSEQVKRGRVTDRYWIVDATVNIVNTYNDPDVNMLIALLNRTQVAGYQSLMIMKHGTDYRPNSQPEAPQSESGQGESQPANPPSSGEVDDGTPIHKVPASPEQSGDSGEPV